VSTPVTRPRRRSPLCRAGSAATRRRRRPEIRRASARSGLPIAPGLLRRGRRRAALRAGGPRAVGSAVRVLDLACSRRRWPWCEVYRIWRLTPADRHSRSLTLPQPLKLQERSARVRPPSPGVAPRSLGRFPAASRAACQNATPWGHPICRVMGPGEEVGSVLRMPETAERVQPAVDPSPHVFFVAPIPAGYTCTLRFCNCRRDT
jgi:hypothetical protein